MPVRISGLTVLLCTLGCAASSLPGTPGSTDTAPPNASPRTATEKRAPLQLTVTGPAAPRAGEALTITAEVTRNVPFSVPIDAILHLPPGVRLVEGNAVAQILPSAETGVRALRFVVVADPLPETDLVISLDARGQGFGFHTEKAYHFGRSASSNVTAPELGDELKVGAHNAGPSVKLTPSSRQK